MAPLDAMRWSEEAADDLERIANYLFEETPQDTRELVRSIYAAPAALLQFPQNAGLVLTPVPYIVIYRSPVTPSI